MRPFASLAGDARLIVAPEALSRFYLGSSEGGAHGARVGATWMTREDRLSEIADYVRWLDRALDAAAGGFDPMVARLHVLGFSQGAVTATRWLHDRHTRGLPPAARLVLWGGAVPHDLDLAADGDVLRQTPLTLVVGDEDQFANAAMVAEQMARLDDADVPYSLVRYRGGHRIDPDVLATVLDASP